MYKNKINKKLGNAQQVFSTLDKNSQIDFGNEKSSVRGIIYDNVSIDKKINDIFSADDYIYKADVKIVTDNGVMDKRIVARNQTNLITMDNEYIPISMIRDIYK